MKKILIGSYFLVMIGIVVVIISTYVTDRKTNQTIAAGAKVYQQQCVICHGKTGKGEGARQLNENEITDVVSYIRSLQK